MEQAELTIEVPAQYSGSAFGAIKNMGIIKDQQWKSDGSLLVKLQIQKYLKIVKLIIQQG